MAATIVASTVLRKGSIYISVEEDGVLSNFLSMAGAGSDFRVVCDICGQGFKEKIPAYKHIKHTQQ